jgi:hypothetical protein
MTVAGSTPLLILAAVVGEERQYSTSSPGPFVRNTVQGEFIPHSSDAALASPPG